MSQDSTRPTVVPVDQDGTPLATDPHQDKTQKIIVSAPKIERLLELILLELQGTDTTDMDRGV